MQSISITRAREKLPDLMEDVYFKSKSFLITRRGIPMAKLTVTQNNKSQTKYKYNQEEIDKAIKGVTKIWKNRWRGKTNTEVAHLLRKKAWSSHAR